MVPFSAWMIRLRVHLPRWGLHPAPGPVGQTAARFSLDPLSLLLRDLNYLTHPPPPSPPAASAQRHSPTPRPLSSLSTPHNSLSIHPFTTAGGRRSKRGNGASFTAASSPGHAAMAAPSSGHHAAVRKVVSASFQQGNWLTSSNRRSSCCPTEKNFLPFPFGRIKLARCLFTVASN